RKSNSGNSGSTFRNPNSTGSRSAFRKSKSLSPCNRAGACQTDLCCTAESPLLALSGQSTDLPNSGGTWMPARTAAEHATQARKLRHRAEECRTLARLMTTKDTTASYLSLANAYDALAEQ